jgi:hypothetical protein
MKEEPTVEALLITLSRTRNIVCEAAEVGFNWKSGNWVERLYENNGLITKAINGYIAKRDESK